ncbi:MAG TPA: VWA domain-containing protein [Candidatus Paraprevotella stercorigallinarum]|jgi:Ca-activated chloride channel family protein|nr:VWA domain-containing protein [Candidatus Paraprevotella stercorigallinarum]
MFRFGEPLYLYLLLLIPLLVAGHYLTNYLRIKRLKRYGDMELLKALMPDVSKYRPEVKFWLMAGALALLIVTLARPQFGTKVDTRKRQGIEAIIAMDISNSMLAQDVTPSRLDKAKMLVSSIVDQMTDDKIGLIVYAGEAYTQLPITSDYVSAKMFLETISPSLITTQGTDIKQAIDLAMKSFTPNQDVSKAIFVITDGEDNEGGAVEMAREAAKHGIKVYVLGIGLPEGAPIPMPGASGYMLDQSGNTVISKLNEQMCREIAEAGQGAYIYVDNSSSAQTALSGYVDKLAKKEMESVIYSEYDEQFQAVALLALVLLVMEILIMSRKNPLFKGIKLFRK